MDVPEISDKRSYGCYYEARLMAIRHSLFLRDKHSPIAHGPVVELVQGLFDTFFGHRKLLNDRLDLVSCSEIKHAHVDIARCDDGALNRDSFADEWHCDDESVRSLLLELLRCGAALTVRNAEVSTSNANRMDCAVRRHYGNDLLPIRLSGSCNEEVIKCTGDFQLVNVLCCHELVCSQPRGLIFLSVRAREHNHVASHLGGELNGEMAYETSISNFSRQCSGSKHTYQGHQHP